ncbi:mitochondrial proton/calcium exchanger protein-like protein isoform X1 [Tanacetum coccineum]
MEMQQVVLFYNRLDVPTRQILDSRVRSTETSDGLAAIQAQLNNLGREIKKRNNSNPSYQERRQSMEDTLIKFTSESTKRHEENSNLIKEIRAATDAAIRNQGASIKTLEIKIRQISKVLLERGFGSLPSSTETNPRDEVKSISTTIEADSYSIRRIGSSQYAVSIGQNNTLLYKSRQTMVPFLSRLDNHYCEEEEGNYELKFAKAYGASHINDTIPQKEKDPGSFTLPCYINNVCFDNALVDLGSNVVPLILRRPFLSTARAKIDVYKRKITLRVREEKIVFTSVKSASSLIKRVYIISLREIIELDLEARLMGETLVLNRSLDPFLEDCIELNDLNEPFELRRNQGDDLIPTIDEGEVIDEFRTRDEDLDTGIDDYPSFEFTHINFFPLLYVNVMSKKSHNSIMKDKMVYKGDNVVGTLMNVPIFVGTFSVVTDFAILENMDAYRNEEMGDVIVGEPRHFKTLSLDELRSPDFNLRSDQEYSKEEVAKTMAETMEQYMSKTRADYGSGVARPKIKDKVNFELKGQFLNELHTNTFSGSDHEDANEDIEKVLEMVDLFHIPNITIDQVMLRVFPMSLTRAASRWLRKKPSGLITTWEDLKTKFLSKYCPPARTAKKIEEINKFQQEPDENLYQAWEQFKELLMKCPRHYLMEMQEVVLFYNGLDVSTRNFFDSRGVIPSKIAADTKVAIQQMAEYSQKWHNETSRVRSNETSDGLAVIQAQMNNLGREIKKVNEKVYAAQVGCEQCKGPHYTKDSHSKRKEKLLKKLTTRNLVDLFKEGDIEQWL